MGLHIEEASAKEMTPTTMRAGDIYGYAGDDPEATVLALDYGDSDGVLLIYGTSQEIKELSDRIAAEVKETLNE